MKLFAQKPKVKSCRYYDINGTDDMIIALIKTSSADLKQIIFKCEDFEEWAGPERLNASYWRNCDYSYEKAVYENEFLNDILEYIKIPRVKKVITHLNNY